MYKVIKISFYSLILFFAFFIFSLEKIYAIPTGLFPTGTSYAIPIMYCPPPSFPPGFLALQFEVGSGAPFSIILYAYPSPFLKGKKLPPLPLLQIVGKKNPSGICIIWVPCPTGLCPVPFPIQPSAHTFYYGN